MDLHALISEILDHIRGMWRFRWHAVLVAWIAAILGWTAIYRMPDVYEASAEVSVDTNSLLPNLTKGLTASENIIDEVGLVSRAMLTRPNLEAVARATDLDLRATTPEAMEILITGLQDRVNVVGGRDRIFTISFQDKSREKARLVVHELLDIFMEQSLGAQGDDADMTERALESEIADHEQRLIKAESDLANFKKRNLGYMPDDGADYYSRLQNALGAVAETEREMRLLRQRRDEIQRQIVGEEPVFGIMGSQNQAVSSCSKAASIAELQAQLAALQVDFTDKHPRIVMLRETITTLEDACRQELASLPPSSAAPRASQSLDNNPVYQNLRLQLSNAEVELASLQEELASRRQLVAQLRADVDKIAEVETEMKRLNRDYGVIEGRHQELLERWETLQSKRRLDPVTDPLKFTILEPPFASAIPVAPKRLILLQGVLVFAIGFGVAIAFALNQLRPAFFSRHSITQSTGLPVLGSVSMILSNAESRSKRRRFVGWVLANVCLVIAAGVVIAFEAQILQLMGQLGGKGL